MRQLADCHMHTELCGHAEGTPSEMMAAIEAAGLAGAIMTEHLPLKPELDPDGTYAMRGDVDLLYVAELRDIRFDWDDLDLVIGAESDWMVEDPSWTAESVRSARANGVEVVLGSIHFLDGWAFDDPSQMAEWARRDVDRVWDHYFSEWIKAAKSGLFDVMSHPDLVKKFGHWASTPEQYYLAAAEAAAEAGIFVEVSTAGWRKPVGEQYPAEFMIRELIQRGVGLTLASDAHHPNEVGYRLNDAADLLVRCGATHMAYPQRDRGVRWLELT